MKRKKENEIEEEDYLIFVSGLIIILHMAAKTSSLLLLQYNDCPENRHLTGDIAKHFTKNRTKCKWLNYL